MDKSSEYHAILSNREQSYRFLGRLYKKEVEQDLFDKLTQLPFSATEDNTELDEGYQRIAAYLKQPGPDPITDLAVDYARVFLGAGIAKEDTAAYPYESVYTSPEKLIMQDARDKVLVRYRAKGLDKVESLEVPEDHIALEFEFMAFLCAELIQAMNAGDKAKISTSLMEQRLFLEQHMLNWVPNFCADIHQCAATDFYQGLANVTNAYLRMDLEIIEALAEIPACEAA